MRTTLFAIGMSVIIATGMFSTASAVETRVRHSSGIFEVTLPDGWGWRETPGPFPNGDGASVGGEALFQLIVAPAQGEDSEVEMKRYLRLVQERWADAALSGQPRGTMLGSEHATICRLVFKDQGMLIELRTIFISRAGNTIIAVMRTPSDLAARFESNLREILTTVKVRPAPGFMPPAGPPPTQPAAPPQTTTAPAGPLTTQPER